MPGTQREARSEWDYSLTVLSTPVMAGCGRVCVEIASKCWEVTKRGPIMQRSKRQLTAAMTVAAVLGFVGGHALAQTTNLKLAHGATTDQALGKGMLKFAELVKSKSDGKVNVETHLAGSLYSERTALEAMVNGAIDLGGASNANWAAFTNTFLFMDLPYVFDSEASFRTALDGVLGDEIRKRMDRDGFKLLMILDNGGFREIINTKREIKVPADVKGLKFRTTASPVEIAMFKNWQGITTAIDWAETYNAMGSGVVDGTSGQPTWFAAAKHYEVAKYAVQNKAVIGISTLAMRKDRFDGLPAAIQKVLLDAAKEAQPYSNKLDQESLESSLAQARKLGVKTYTPTPEEMKGWRSTGRAIWKDFDSKIDKDLFNIVLKSQQGK